MGYNYQSIYKDIKKLKLAVISHTEHYLSENNIIVGWGPTIKELNKLVQICDVIYHIAPLHTTNSPGSALPYNSDKIIFVPLSASWGAGLQKLSILFTAPFNLYKIFKTLKKVDKVQFRAPTGMGIYVLPFLSLYPSGKYWVKYAGNWVSENLPLGNKFQKHWLQHCTSLATKLTINGSWQEERANVIPFENPCLDENDRKLGKQLIHSKTLSSQVNFCFVGALNEHKGVPIILEALKEMDSDINFHFIGDGKDKSKYLQLAKALKVTTYFYGFLKKDDIVAIYTKCEFIVLPSRSEGFPKVIGEAMNFGCIPIVSDVSCISQYIQNGVNGFLTKPITSKEIIKNIQLAIKLNGNEKEKIKKYNYELAEKFTYEYYNHRIKNEIFEIKK